MEHISTHIQPVWCIANYMNIVKLMSETGSRQCNHLWSKWHECESKCLQHIRVACVWSNHLKMNYTACIESHAPNSKSHWLREYVDVWVSKNKWILAEKLMFFSSWLSLTLVIRPFKQCFFVKTIDFRSHMLKVLVRCFVFACACRCTTARRA